MDKIRQDPRNARTHSDEQKESLSKSLDELGAGRSIVVDEDNVIVSGNGVYEQAKELGIPVKEIETSGEELVVVRRVDLKTDDPRRKALALADNQIATLAEWDELKLEELQTEVLGEIEFETMGFEEQDEGIDNDNYTRKIEAPTYEPKGKKPDIDELYDTSKTDILVEAIDSAKGITDKEREFLRVAAQRHTVLRFDKIADFYAHSDQDIQELMEDSALVIIDFDKAIEQGFVELGEKIGREYGIDYGTS